MTKGEGNDLRVLIVEDSKTDLLLLLDELERGGYGVDYAHVETLEDLRRALEQEWQLVISDYSLPTMDAHDVLRELTSRNIDTPCIVMSGTVSEEAAVDLLRAGARDFVVKERAFRLLPAIKRELAEAAQRRRQREAERALNETRERMRFALESVGIGTWEADLRTGAMHWSEVMERLHGLQPGSFDGTFEGFIAAIHPDDRDEVKRQIDQVVQDRSDSRLVYRTVWPDGSIHWLVGIGRLRLGPDGTPIGAVGVQMDITEQKLLEEQLRQAQKMESIGSLASGIAHDFNNLLTVIQGYGELAAAAVPPSSPAAESLEAIRAAAVSAAALTRQLLTFSRRQILAPRVLDLNETIAAFGSILRRIVEESVEIVIRPAPALPRVRMDPSQVEQLVLNLVANARDAMPHGGRVTITTFAATLNAGDTSLDPDVRPGEYVALRVSDTGAGMPVEIQRRVFEPFFTTKPRGQGTGLGLATVYGIVKQSGGQITLESEPGVGTTFTIYLPVAPSEAAAEDDAARSSADLAGNETILLVEDNAPLRRLTARMLERYGYRVLVATSGEHAREVCQRHEGLVAAAVLDVVMPGDGGVAIAEWLAAVRPETRVIFVSGYTGDASGRLEALGSVLLQKPFTPEQLARAVRTALAQPA